MPLDYTPKLKSLEIDDEYFYLVRYFLDKLSGGAVINCEIYRAYQKTLGIYLLSADARSNDISDMTPPLADGTPDFNSTTLPLAEVEVRRDGCSDIRWPDRGGGAHHFCCGPHGWEKFAYAISECHNIAHSVWGEGSWDNYTAFFGVAVTPWTSDECDLWGHDIDKKTLEITGNESCNRCGYFKEKEKDPK